jgi:hypothetical protein
MLPMINAKYNARACSGASFAPASTGNKQIAINMEVTDGEFAGSTIAWISTFHDTADKNGVTGSERIIQSLQYMGWQGDDLTELVEITDEQARQMLPETVSIVCEPDTFDGKTRLKVKWVNKQGGKFAFKEAESKSDMRSFAAQMKSTVKAVRASNGGPRPAPQQQTRAGERRLHGERARGGREARRASTTSRSLPAS